MIEVTQREEKTKTVTVVIVEDYKLTRVGLTAALNSYPDINVIGEACEWHPTRNPFTTYPLLQLKAV